MNTLKTPIIGLFAVIIALIFAACKQPTEDPPAPTLTGITADYTQGSTVIYPTTQLDTLKAGLTVKAKYSDNTTKDVTDYELSGTLEVGASAITVTYEGKETAFNVTVTAVPNTAITYTIEQTGGVDGTTTSTGIVFTFSASVDSLNLSAADITVGGAASKGLGALSGTGTSRTLPITVNNAGLATVSIAKDGIEADTKSVSVHKEGEVDPEYRDITWNLNGGAVGTGAYPELIVKGDVLAQPSPDPTKAGHTFGGWYTDSNLTAAYNFTGAVTVNLNLYAQWTPNSAGITINIKQIEDETFTFEPITISRTGSGSVPVTFPVTVENDSSYTSISWEVAGVGAGQTVTGSGASFTLNAANVNYNSLGGHALILTVTKGAGINALQYRRAISFIIVQ